jgi:protein ImuB
MLWACLLLPSLPLDVFARAQAPSAAAQPLVIGSGGHYPRVVAANAAARDAGIHDEQLVSSALALAPHLVLRDRDGDAEARALAQLATFALTFTPMTCLAPPNAVVAEIGASLRLFGGLPRLVAHLAGGVHALGYANRLGLAPTPGAALLLARAGHARPVVERARLPEMLTSLPLTLVDLDDATRATLRDAGITTFGQAAALPRQGLARRFGPALVDLIDRVLGLSPTGFSPAAWVRCA